LQRVLILPQLLLPGAYLLADHAHGLCLQRVLILPQPRLLLRKGLWEVRAKYMLVLWLLLVPLTHCKSIELLDLTQVLGLCPTFYAFLPKLILGVTE